MKKIKWFSILMIMTLLVGCSAKADDMAASGEVNSSMDSGMMFDESAKEETGEIMDYESTTDGSRESVSTNRKIIERVYMDVETKEFDALIDKLHTEIQAVGGYVERSSMSGNGLGYEGNRYADFTIRIPSDRSNGFTEFVSANSTVTNKEISTEDVTLSYVDMESRVSALETEKAALEKLLAEAEALEDIIKIQDRLTDVIYEIESYKSQLRTYDNLIDYTTISIFVREVERVTIVEEQSVWEEIKTKLADNVGNIGKGCVELFVFVISNIPYILIFAIAAIVAIRIVKKVKKKRE